MSFLSFYRKHIFSATIFLCLSSPIISQNVGIGTTTPHALLQLANALSNRKIVIFETANNDNQYLGFGNNNGTLRYQVDATAADHVFYAGTSSSTSQELFRVKGNGNIGIGVNPVTKLDIGGTNGWDLVNGEGDVRIGNASYRLKMGVALGGGGVGAAGIMQAGGIGSLALGAGGKFLVNMNGPSGFVDFTNNTGGLRINGNGGTDGQVLTSTGAGAPAWKPGPSFTYANSVNLSSTNYQTVNAGQTWVIPGLSYSFTTTIPTRAFLSFNGYLRSIVCTLCGTEWVDARLRVNGNTVFENTFTLPNNTLINMSGSALVTLPAGSYTINVDVHPGFNQIEIGGNNTNTFSNMQVMLFPSN